MDRCKLSYNFKFENIEFLPAIKQMRLFLFSNWVSFG